MATNQPPNQNQTIDELQSIQANLLNINDQYREWNKQAHIYNSSTIDTMKKTTELNKLISKSLDISSKIGKELIKRKDTKRLINQLEAESNKLSRSYQTTYEKLTKLQQKQVDLLGQQQDQFRSLTKESDQLESDYLEAKENQVETFEKLLDLENKGLKNTKQFVDLEKQFNNYSQQVLDNQNEKINVESKIQTLNKEIAKAYKNQAVSTALVQRTQAEAAKNVLNVTRSLPKEVEQGNKALQKRNFLQEAFSRVPILKNMKMLPKHMEDFG